MLAPNFSRKSTMNVNDVIQDNIPDKIYSSILFTLVNLPYRNNSIDIELITIDNQEYKCYKNHYRFDNGSMIIIKIASTEFVPYGIYARKIINFLIAEFSYKMNLPHIYDENARRMIKLGKKPIDFIEKLSGKRSSGSSSAKTILMQLQGILNCHMAIATGYKQMNPKDDEVLAKDTFQFAFIESYDEQLINHRFNVFDNWQEEIYISDDLAKILSQHIMPLDKVVYSQIKSPMELDVYQYYTYQNYNCIKKGTDLVNYDWEDTQKLFGRGYAKTSQGIAHFRADFRKNLESLKTKVNLQISAPQDAKYITFVPQKPLTTIGSTSAKSWSELEYESYKDILEDLPSISGSEKITNHDNKNDWHNFNLQYNLKSKFDTNAIKQIKQYFENNSIDTIKAVEYALSKTSRNPSAYIMKALSGNWIKKNDDFHKKISEWQNIYKNLTKQEVADINTKADKALVFLKSRYSPEQFSIPILTAIYAKLSQCNDTSIIIKELDGSKYKQHFERHFELWNI
jgi:hypothetical protein